MSTSSSSSEYLVYPCCVRLSKFPTKLLIDGFEVPEPLVTGSGISCFLSVAPVWEAHECLVLLVEKHEILRRIEYPAHFCRIGNFMTGYLHLKIVASSHQWGAFDQWGPLYHCVRNLSPYGRYGPRFVNARFTSYKAWLLVKVEFMTWRSPITGFLGNRILMQFEGMRFVAISLSRYHQLVLGREPI